jgi:hypothetical protein
VLYIVGSSSAGVLYIVGCSPGVLYIVGCSAGVLYIAGSRNDLQTLHRKRKIGKYEPH